MYELNKFIERMKYVFPVVLIVAIIAVVSLHNGQSLQDDSLSSSEVVADRVFTQQDYIDLGSPDSLVISPEFTSIGDGAFSGCDNLSYISLPLSVSHIGKSAFFDCSALTSVSLPDSLMGIANYAFASCTALEAIELPLEVESIGDGAFRDCMNIRTISIPVSVTEIGSAVFERCDKLQAIYLVPSSGVYQTLKNEYEEMVISRK